MKKGLVFITLLVGIVFSITMLDIHLYSQRTAARSADVAVVLGASVINDEPSPVFEQRIRHAVGLYHQGLVSKLVFTGAIGSGDSISESEAAKRFAIAHGVLAEDILTESKSTITLENLSFAHQAMQREDLSSILLVSDPLHMKRAMAMAKFLDLDAYPSPTKTSRYQSARSKSLMLLSETLLFIWFNIESGFE